MDFRYAGVTTVRVLLLTYAGVPRMCISRNPKISARAIGSYSGRRGDIILGVRIVGVNILGVKILGVRILAVKILAVRILGVSPVLRSGDHTPS